MISNKNSVIRELNNILCTVDNIEAELLECKRKEREYINLIGSKFFRPIGTTFAKYQNSGNGEIVFIDRYTLFKKGQILPVLKKVNTGSGKGNPLSIFDILVTEKGEKLRYYEIARRLSYDTSF